MPVGCRHRHSPAWRHWGCHSEQTEGGENATVRCTPDLATVRDPRGGTLGVRGSLLLFRVSTAGPGGQPGGGEKKMTRSSDNKNQTDR